MRKNFMILLTALVLFSSFALADMMDWNWGMMGGPGMMGSGWWPFGASFGVFGVMWVIIWILGFLFWLWMLIDAITRKFDDNIEKLIWILVIVFTTIIGALIYYFVIKARNKSSAVSRSYREQRPSLKK